MGSKRIILGLFFSIAAATMAVGQPVQSKYDTLYVFTDVQPQYTGGDMQFYIDLGNLLTVSVNETFRLRIERDGYQAVLGFVVNKQGAVDSLFHDRLGRDAWLDREIAQAFSEMEQWQPGRVNNNPVNTLVYIELILHATTGSITAVYQPIYPNSYVLADKHFDKKWTKWAILGVVAVIGLFYLLSRL